MVFLTRGDLLKKKVIITIFLIVFVIISVVTATMWLNPNLNILKLKSVENNALEYIHQTYPEFKVDDISVKHEWKSNNYVVEYSDDKGETRTVIFDHTGVNVFVDEYIRDTAFSIIYDYENSINLKVTEALKSELNIDVYYVNVEDTNAYGKERDIVLNGLDISKDSVNCSIGITGEDNGLSLEFAKLSKEIYCTISSLELPIENIEIHQQNSPDSRFDITCPMNMGEMDIEDIDKLVKK